MAYYVAGDTIQEPFISESLATGLTFTRVASYQAGSAVTWNPTIAEVGSGAYTFTYVTTTASTTGSWVWVATASNGETVTWEFDLNATTATVTLAASATGALTRTRKQLRQQVADRFGDLVQLTATANGSAGKTTFLDTININDGTQHMTGRELFFTSGSNNGLSRRVTATDSTTGTLTFAAVTAQTATNDTADVYNRFGRGFVSAQYNRAINNAINDAYPTGKIAVVADVTSPATFDAESPTVTVPASIVDINTVEFEDSSGIYHTVPKARSRNGEGWFADKASGEIRIHGRIAWEIHGLALRIHGLGRQAELSSDTDTCSLSPEFIVARAAYHLALGAVDNEDHAVRVNLFRDESERYRVKLITQLRDPFGGRVRAA